MLVVDDDDDVLEGLEVEAREDAYMAEAAPAASDAAITEELANQEYCRHTLEGINADDFSLLPHVQALVQAHRTGGTHAAEEAMKALRRAARRAEACLATLRAAEAATSAEEDRMHRRLLHQWLSLGERTIARGSPTSSTS